MSATNNEGSADNMSAANIEGSAGDMSAANIEGSADDMSAANIEGSADDMSAANIEGSDDDMSAANIEGSADDMSAANIEGSDDDMSAANIEGSDDVDESVFCGPDYHIFIYEFFVFCLGDKETWTFKKVFESNCETLPTNWKCHMVFLKVQPDGRPRMFFFLERMDTLPQPVKVEIEFVINAVVLPGFERELMCGGKIEHMFAPDINNYDILIHATIQIGIFSCHTQDGHYPITCESAKCIFYQNDSAST